MRFAPVGGARAPRPQAWCVMACARCGRIGHVLYRGSGRSSAAIAQGRRSGWRDVGEVVACPAYRCQEMAARWAAAETAELGLRAPFCYEGQVWRDYAIHDQALAIDVPAAGNAGEVRWAIAAAQGAVRAALAWTRAAR